MDPYRKSRITRPNISGALKVALVLVCVFALAGETFVGMAEPNRRRVIQDDNWMALRFEPNEGQADDDVMFLARGRGVSFLLKSTEVVMRSSRGVSSSANQRDFTSAMLSSTSRSQHASPAINTGAVEPPALIMRLVNANSHPRAAGLEKLPGKVNSFVGRDSRRWRRDIPTYAKVRYQDVYPGVDVVYYGNPRQLEYDFVVASHADPQTIMLEFPDADMLAVDAQGDLVLHAAGGQFRMRKPLVYQAVDGVQRVIAGGYALKAKHRVGFHIGSYDPARPLVIDPVLGYSTYLGGLGGDSGNSIFVDGGRVYIAGESNGQVFVAKLDPTLTGPASLVYFTVFGGSGGDAGNAIAVSPSFAVVPFGAVYVTGSTSSFDFPVVNAAQSTYGGGLRDAFVTTLDSTGSLVLSTYLGGSGDDVGLGISVRCGIGFATVCASASVTGFTTSLNFPMRNAFQNSYGGGASDAFVTEVGSGSLAYSTYLGGSGEDVGSGITAVDVLLGAGIGGETYVTGFTTSTDFPTASPLQAVHGGGVHDAFVTKLNAAGSALIYSTYLGGSGSDRASGLVGGGSVLVQTGSCLTGTTTSTDFPTVNPLQAAYGGGPSDAFVTCLNASGSGLAYSTYLGGSGEDIGSGIAGAFGDVYVTGSTNSQSTFPKNKRRLPSGGLFDAFVTRLNPAASRGASLVFSTLLGGSGDDHGLGIAVDGLGFVYVTGQTESADFPTTSGAFQTTFGGAPSDAFVAEIIP